MDETAYDGWADLSAQRRAQDEALVQEYAAGEGRGMDMRPIRGFVQHVRRDIGPRGEILKVRKTPAEIIVWYRLPGEKAGGLQTASATDTPPMGAPAPGDLAALSRPSATTPASPAGVPSPAPRRSPAEGQAWA
jgi:hypothetical protein